MPNNRRRIESALRGACSQHLWTPVPLGPGDAIVDAAYGQIAPEDVDT